MRDIDKQTNRLLAESARRIDGNAVWPDRSGQYPLPDGLNAERLRDKTPPTVNPPASKLEFTAADEARDVAERLRVFQEQSLQPANARQIDLIEALRQAQETSREHITAQEDYILAAIALLVQQHQFSPRFFDNVIASYGNAQIDGDTTESVARIMNELGVRQRLPFGGDLAARFIWDASEDLRTSTTGQYEQSSRLIFEGNIPLLRGFGDVAQEDLIQARRELVYSAREFEDFRRTFLVAIARDYFNLLLQQDAIENQEAQLESLQALERRQAEWFDAGRIPAFEVRLARNNVLNAVASLANQVEQYILSLDAFKIRLGISVTEPIEILPFELPVPEPEVDLDTATALALDLRLDLQNTRDRVDDSKRAIRNARNQLLPDLDLAGNVVLPTDADAMEGGAVFEPDDVAYGASVTFGLPLDRKIERLQLRTAVIGYQRAERELDRFIDSVVLDVRGRVREIERARLNLELAQERVKITELRQDEQEIKADEIETQEIVDTENDLLEARSARDQARTDLRNAILDYLIATGQFRVDREGKFLPLSGMTLIPPQMQAPAAPQPEAAPGQYGSPQPAEGPDADEPGGSAPVDPTANEAPATTPPAEPAPSTEPR